MPVAAAPDDILAAHADVRAGGRPPLLVLEPLADFLDAHALGRGPIEASPIGEGHSNVTYLIHRAEAPELVLRRPPRPPLPPSAHDVLREARLLSALGPTAIRVPKVLATCADQDVIGAPFYVMERLPGQAIVSEPIPALDMPSERARIGEQLIEALAEIHAVDYLQAGLQDFGRPDGYLERQLRRFGGLWQVNKVREIPALERVQGWLAAHMPADDHSRRATIVHGDFRLGNTLFATSAPAELTAVLDWELSTIGDPLADLGYLCMMWTEADDPSGGLSEHLGAITRAAGFPTRAELIERYEQLTGRRMADIRWYTGLALWKTAVFMEGNYRRAVQGATDDPYLKRFGEGVLELAERAEGVIADGR